jgi:F0F1-type ATP synthase assembly protein I
MEQHRNRTWKPETESENDLERYATSLQEGMRRSGPIAGAGYTLIGAIIMLGLIGYWLDRWLGCSPWFLLGGLLLGIIIGFYNLAKVIWKP